MTYSDKQELGMMRSTDDQMKRLRDRSASGFDIRQGAEVRLSLDLAFLAGVEFSLAVQAESLDNMEKKITEGITV